MATYRNVLVVTLGSAPAVVTETVYALIRPDPQDGEPAREPWIPHEIHVVTTVKGRADGNPLLRGEQSELAKLFHQLGCEPVDANFVVPALRDGTEVQDIRTREENIAYANRLKSLISEPARSPDTCLHVSMAGGRKTMSAYAHAAISLFGRVQDELSHILVEPQVFEKPPHNKNFLWPGQPREIVVEQDSVKYSSSDAKVIMVRSPFVPLRKYLERRHPFPEGDVDYARIVEQIRMDLSESELILDVASSTATFAGKTIELGAQEFAFLRVLAVARKENWRGFGPRGSGEDQSGWVAFKQFRDPRSVAYARFSKYWDDRSVGIAGHGDEKSKQDFEEMVRSINDPRTKPSIKERDAKKAQGVIRSAKMRVVKKMEDESGQGCPIRSADFWDVDRKGTCIGLYIAPSAITIRERGASGA